MAEKRVYGIFCGWLLVLCLLPGLVQAAELTREHILAMHNGGIRMALGKADGTSEKPYVIPVDIDPAKLLGTELLDFSGRPLVELPPWLGRFNKLRKLDLSKTGIKADDALLAALGNMPELDVLKLSDNPLFPEKSCWMFCDPEVSLAAVWSKLTGLTEINLTNTGGTAANLGSFAALENLTHLYLGGNRIGDEVNKLGLGNPSNVRYLNLANNGIHDSPLPYLPTQTLVELDLSGNALSEVPFIDMPNLVAWDVSGNPKLKLADGFGGLFALPKLSTMLVDSDSQLPLRLAEEKRRVEEASIKAAEKKRQAEEAAEKKRREEEVAAEAVEKKRQAEKMANKAAEEKRRAEEPPAVTTTAEKKAAGYVDRSITRRGTYHVAKTEPAAKTAEEAHARMVEEEKLRSAEFAAKVAEKKRQAGIANAEAQRRYRINGDGTVTDTQTGLMWKQCSEGQAGNNCSGEATKYTWNDAMLRFNNGVGFAGYSDWRMPTFDELVTLIHCSPGYIQALEVDEICAGPFFCRPYTGELQTPRANKECAGNYQPPTINKQAFPHTPPWYYWSSSKDGSGKYAQAVRFSSGDTGIYYLGGEINVRLVRSTQ